MAHPKTDEALPENAEAPVTGYKPGDKVFSNKLFAGYIEFMDQKLGKVMTDQVLGRMNLDRLTLGDLNGYSSDEVSQAVTMAATELTGEKRLSYLVGRNLPNSIGRIGGFIAGVTSPAFFMKGIGGIEGRLALKTVNKTTQVGKNRFRVEITYKDGFMARDYVCDNRIGCYESAPLFFGLPYAKVEHPQCVHRNEGNCVYYVQFPEYGFLVFNRAAQVFFIAALASVVAALTIHVGPWFRAVPGALLLGALASFSWYKHLSAKKSLEWSLFNNETLVNQNLVLDVLNTKLTALQKLTSTLVECRTADEACAIVAEGLVKDLRFGSGQIWLLDGRREYIHCAGAEGYPEEIRRLIMDARFLYKDNLDNSHGLLVQTMLQGKTIIANDMAEVLPRLAEQSRNFLEALNLSSFIMTPLIHDNRPLGILAGEYHKGEKIEIHDQMIFQSLSLVMTSILMRTTAGKPIAGLSASPAAGSAPAPFADGSAHVAENVANAMEGPMQSIRTVLSGFSRNLEGMGKFRIAAYREATSTEALGSLKKIEREYGIEAAMEGIGHDVVKAGAALAKCEALITGLQVLAGSLGTDGRGRIDVGQTVRRAIDSLSRAESGSMDVTVEVSLGLTASGSEAGLIQACKALALNAAEAMGGRGRLEITGTQSDGLVRLMFRDHGPGIPKEFQSRVFEPFFTTKPPGQGMGMGLAVARNHVRNSEGDLTLETVPAPGKGALFILTLKNA
ncbi:MAG: sensor signal transduction histidine kinase [Fibrobacteres bacterium]|nr:sensor signal transduction histidine kinase [Fibrobacterota bacterium]